MLFLEHVASSEFGSLTEVKCKNTLFCLIMCIFFSLIQLFLSSPLFFEKNALFLRR